MSCGIDALSHLQAETDLDAYSFDSHLDLSGLYEDEDYSEVSDARPQYKSTTLHEVVSRSELPSASATHEEASELEKELRQGAMPNVALRGKTRHSDLWTNPNVEEDESHAQVAVTSRRDARSDLLPNTT
eukprot:2519799-Amphidinium_carterae.1